MMLAQKAPGYPQVLFLNQTKQQEQNWQKLLSHQNPTCSHISAFIMLMTLTTFSNLRNIRRLYLALYGYSQQQQQGGNVQIC